MADITYRRRFGDRREGRLLRSLPAYNKITPYIMQYRNDSCNCFADSVEISKMDQWLREKRLEGYKGLGLLHVFIASYVRAVASYPGLNRFVSGQKIYARNNIEILMTVKKSMATDAEETSIKVVCHPTDTIFDVYRKMNEKIDEIKASDDTNGTEDVANALMRLPGFILRFTVWVLRCLDYIGLLPKSIMDVSPFHGSMIITDMGSLGIPPIYHHIYNFGNLPIFISLGKKRRVYELDKDGQAVERKYVDFKIVTDERTVDGLYYATAIKQLWYYFKNPSILETPPEKVVEDVF